jgi:hypothetical protein
MGAKIILKKEMKEQKLVQDQPELGTGLSLTQGSSLEANRSQRLELYRLVSRLGTCP